MNGWDLVLSFFLGIVTSVIGSSVYLALSRRTGNRYLHLLFNFGSDEVILVFTHGG